MRLHKQPTALIVGAGVGGLASAILLARGNYKVTVLEKNSGPGGRCAQFTRDGHVFDTGPTFYVFPELYRRMFSLMGESVEEHLELLRVDPTHSVWFDDNSVFEPTADQKRMRQQLETFEQGSFERFF